MRVRDLAEWLDAPFEGDGEREVLRAAPLEAAGPDEVAFVGNRKAAEQARHSGAGCVIVPLEFPGGSGRTLIRAYDPRTLFARAVRRLHPGEPLRPGIHPTASIGSGVELGTDCEIGPFSSIGDDSRIGPRVRIGAGSAIGRRVSLGADSILRANVSIYDGVRVGARALLHSGCVIGADGFGFALAGDHYEKFPQIGGVEIGDDVEIGANSCVDRAALGITSIGSGTKLDNMVHVAHNCRIGRHVVVAAQTGFSGGVVVEDYAVIGGQVGVGDKAKIETRAVLGSGSGVLTSKIVRAGQVVWGTPARPLREHLEQLASLARLPGVRKQLAELRKRLDSLEHDGRAGRNRGA